MFYYILPKIGTGSNIDPFRPDIPVDISYVCQECRNQFLVGVDVELDNYVALTSAELENYCYYNRITDIASWASVQ